MTAAGRTNGVVATSRRERGGGTKLEKLPAGQLQLLLLLARLQEAGRGGVLRSMEMCARRRLQSYPRRPTSAQVQMESKAGAEQNELAPLGREIVQESSSRQWGFSPSQWKSEEMGLGGESNGRTRVEWQFA